MKSDVMFGGPNGGFVAVNGADCPATGFEVDFDGEMGARGCTVEVKVVMASVRARAGDPDDRWLVRRKARRQRRRPRHEERRD